MPKPDKSPVRVACKLCSHEWDGLYLPMPITDAAKIMRRLTCPMCSAVAKDIVIAPTPKPPVMNVRDPSRM